MKAIIVADDAVLVLLPILLLLHVPVVAAVAVAVAVAMPVALCWFNQQVLLKVNWGVLKPNGIKKIR